MFAGVSDKKCSGECKVLKVEGVGALSQDIMPLIHRYTAPAWHPQCYLAQFEVECVRTAILTFSIERPISYVLSTAACCAAHFKRYSGPSSVITII